MSWTGGLFDFPVKTSKEKMMVEIREDLDMNRGHMEPVHLPLLLLNVEPFKTREDAEAYLNSDACNRYYRNKNYGVQYLSYDNVKPSKKMQDLQRRINETKQKKIEYAAAHSVNKFKSAYVGCPKCGSKLNVSLVKGDRCPLCYTDLRSDTTIKTLSGYDVKIKDLTKQLNEETKKLASKAELYWLVEADAYLG